VSWVKLIWNAHYSNGEVPHAIKNKGSFWWQDVIKLVDLYRGIASCKMGDDTTVLFWLDVWNETISVDQFLLNNNIEQQFHLPLSVQAF
jgi:hypothetical protein